MTRIPSESAMPATLLHTRSRSYPLQLRVADSFLRRLRGLMLSKPLAEASGLLLTNCPSVHGAFMRFPIDVIYLDRGGVVLKCVPQLRPWRASVSNAGRDPQGRRYPRARHTLELAAGAIARYGIAPGDCLQHPLLDLPAAPPAPRRFGRQRGASMVEFAIVGPIITLIGLALVQYGMLFFAKNQMNQAAFMAARAGAVGNAQLSSVKLAYAKALVPIYGGGQTVTQLATSLATAEADVAANTRIELRNPTKESFADWNDEALQKKLNTGAKRVIPNSNQAFKDGEVRDASGQTIQDANLIKLRITQGYKPTVPVVGSIYKVYLKWQDPGTDAFHSKLIADGRVPVVNDVTMHMQSDAIEGETISSPGKGNGGNPVNPGDPAGPSKPPPNCKFGLVCDDITPGGGGPGGDNGNGGYCDPVTTPVQTTLSADATFAFDSADLTEQGKKDLDALIAKAKQNNATSIDVVGHSDQIGTAEYNQALSERRAKAVADYMASHGLANVKMNVSGKGASDPVTSIDKCPDSATQKSCLAANRRVVVTMKGST
jgi:outer membrane protein OmpA-like peptidoglycan-associated protein/uncharacterized membrane protein (UPF0127 family)